jgi:hypothetical protein
MSRQVKKSNKHNVNEIIIETQQKLYQLNVLEKIYLQRVKSYSILWRGSN